MGQEKAFKERVFIGLRLSAISDITCMPCPDYLQMLRSIGMNEYAREKISKYEPLFDAWNGGIWGAYICEMTKNSEWCTDRYAWPDHDFDPPIIDEAFEDFEVFEDMDTEKVYELPDELYHMNGIAHAAHEAPKYTDFKNDALIDLFIEPLAFVMERAEKESDFETEV